jgi:hypothetical protein
MQLLDLRPSKEERQESLGRNRRAAEGRHQGADVIAEWLACFAR